MDNHVNSNDFAVNSGDDTYPTTQVADNTPQDNNGSSGSSGSSFKKYAGPKVVSTILGLLLLVGGVGTGVALVMQPQLFEQSAQEVVYTTTTIVPCNTVGAVQCGKFADGCGGFCILPVDKTCNDMLLQECGQGSAGNCANVNSPVNTYYCPGSPIGTACQGNTPLPPGVGWDNSKKEITGSFCGTVQVDQIDKTNGLIFCSRYDESGCVTNPPPPQSTPTPTPITASCGAASMYTPNWTPLTSAEFYNLPAGGQVYFCVNGVTNGGAFQKARFTINTILRSEVTLQRPGSTDYCDLYTIPANTYEFNIQGEIYHSTLGWL